jgi:tRNA G18 (ribose-2'-O)-methylase SpoU
MQYGTAYFLLLLWNKMIIVLHNIRSLYNVGSIFRTADAAGVEKIYLGGITPGPTDQFGKYRQQVTKVSLGAEKYIAWEKVKSTAKLIDKLKGEGFKIFAVEQSKKSIPYHLLKAKSYKLKAVALVLGNEVKGLPPAILNRADKILEIPMKGKKESLNVSVAFGIIVFSLTNK